MKNLPKKLFAELRTNPIMFIPAAVLVIFFFLVVLKIGGVNTSLIGNGQKKITSSVPASNQENNGNVDSQNNSVNTSQPQGGNTFADDSFASPTVKDNQAPLQINSKLPKRAQELEGLTRTTLYGMLPMLSALHKHNGGSYKNVTLRGRYKTSSNPRQAGVFYVTARTKNRIVVCNALVLGKTKHYTCMKVVGAGKGKRYIFVDASNLVAAAAKAKKTAIPLPQTNGLPDSPNDFPKNGQKIGKMKIKVTPQQEKQLAEEIQKGKQCHRAQKNHNKTNIKKYCSYLAKPIKQIRPKGYRKVVTKVHGKDFIIWKPRK